MKDFSEWLQEIAMVPRSNVDPTLGKLSQFFHSITRGISDPLAALDRFQEHFVQRASQINTKDEFNIQFRFFKSCRRTLIDIRRSAQTPSNSRFSSEPVQAVQELFTLPNGEEIPLEELDLTLFKIIQALINSFDPFQMK